MSNFSTVFALANQYQVAGVRGKRFPGPRGRRIVGSAIERFRESDIEEVVITDSLPLPEEKQIDKIKQVSVAPLLASAIYATHTGASVSALFR